MQRINYWLVVENGNNQLVCWCAGCCYCVGRTRCQLDCLSAMCCSMLSVGHIRVLLISCRVYTASMWLRAWSVWTADWWRSRREWQPAQPLFRAARDLDSCWCPHSGRSTAANCTASLARRVATLLDWLTETERRSSLCSDHTFDGLSYCSNDGGLSILL